MPRPTPCCIPGSPSYVPGGIRPRLCWTPEKKNHSWILLVCLGEGCLGWNTSSPDIYQDFRQKFLDLLWWRNLHDWGSEGTDRFQALMKRSKTSLHIRSIKGGGMGRLPSRHILGFRILNPWEILTFSIFEDFESWTFLILRIFYSEVLKASNIENLHSF